MEILKSHQQAMADIASKRGGKAQLADEAGVARSTVRSLAQTGWTNVSIELFDKLAAAAKRIKARSEP